METPLGSDETGPTASPKPVTKPGGFKAVVPSSRRENEVIIASETQLSFGKFVKLDVFKAFIFKEK